MKFIFRWIFRLIILCIILCTALILTIDIIAKEIIESTLTKSTRLDVRIDKVDVSLLTPRIRIENLVLYNPGFFGGSKFIQISEAVFEYYIYPLSSRLLRFKLIRIDCTSVHLVNNNNILNIEYFFKQASATNSAPSSPLNFSIIIDVLNISIGTINWVDLNNPARSYEVPVNIRNYIINNLNNNDINPQFLHNLLLQLMLKSGKIAIVDGKLEFIGVKTNNLKTLK